VLVLQPVPASSWLQFVVTVVPVFKPELLTLHPAAVCSVMVSVVSAFTPSMISISPLLGQLGPNIQKAGQTPQIPPGICSMSAMNTPRMSVYIGV
jgi:hypothetical protein